MPGPPTLETTKNSTRENFELEHLKNGQIARHKIWGPGPQNLWPGVWFPGPRQLAPVIHPRNPLAQVAPLGMEPTARGQALIMALISSPPDFFFPFLSAPSATLAHKVALRQS